MKNILIATMIIAGTFTSVSTASAIDNLTTETSNWVLDSYKTGPR